MIVKGHFNREKLFSGIIIWTHNIPTYVVLPGDYLSTDNFAKIGS